jgi:hypothetical protein
LTSASASGITFALQYKVGGNTNTYLGYNKTTNSFTLGDGSTNIYFFTNGTSLTGSSNLVLGVNSSGLAGTLSFTEANTLGTLVYRPIRATSTSPATIALTSLAVNGDIAVGADVVSGQLGSINLAGNLNFTTIGASIGGTINASFASITTSGLFTATGGIRGSSGDGPVSLTGFVSTGTGIIQVSGAVTGLTLTQTNNALLQMGWTGGTAGNYVLNASSGGLVVVPSASGRAFYANPSMDLGSVASPWTNSWVGTMNIGATLAGSTGAFLIIKNNGSTAGSNVQIQFLARQTQSGTMTWNGIGYTLNFLSAATGSISGFIELVPTNFSTVAGTGTQMTLWGGNGSASTNFNVTFNGTDTAFSSPGSFNYYGVASANKFQIGNNVQSGSPQAVFVVDTVNSLIYVGSTRYLAMGANNGIASMYWTNSSSGDKGLYMRSAPTGASVNDRYIDVQTVRVSVIASQNGSGLTGGYIDFASDNMVYITSTSVTANVYPVVLVLQNLQTTAAANANGVAMKFIWKNASADASCKITGAGNTLNFESAGVFQNIISTTNLTFGNVAYPWTAYLKNTNVNGNLVVGGSSSLTGLTSVGPIAITATSTNQTVLSMTNSNTNSSTNMSMSWAGNLRGVNISGSNFSSTNILSFSSSSADTVYIVSQGGSCVLGSSTYPWVANLSNTNVSGVMTIAGIVANQTLLTLSNTTNGATQMRMTWASNVEGITIAGTNVGGPNLLNFSSVSNNVVLTTTNTSCFLGNTQYPWPSITTSFINVVETGNTVNYPYLGRRVAKTKSIISGANNYDFVVYPTSGGSYQGGVVWANWVVVIVIGSNGSTPLTGSSQGYFHTTNAATSLSVVTNNQFVEPLSTGTYSFNWAINLSGDVVGRFNVNSAYNNLTVLIVFSWDVTASATLY